MSTDVDSESVADATALFLEDHTEGTQALEAVLAADAEMTTWTFEDISIDSGTFGELVSRGIVRKVEDEYQLADSESVQAVLNGDSIPNEASTDTTSSILPFRSINRRAVAGLVVALGVVAAARMTMFNSVFQRGYAISPANDPYYFRYWLRRLVADSSGLTDFGVLARSGLTRPISHATNWFFAELLGGNQWAVETVAIWLPIVMSVALGILIYKLALLLTDDVRVGIASVLVLAVTPVHATYTGLGFLDHSIHQYFWLGVTLLTLGWLAVDLQDRLEECENKRRAAVSQLQDTQTWGVVVLFGLSVTAGTHAWGGSPLLLLPLAGYIGFRVPLDVRADFPPLLTNLPIITGLSLGSVLSILLHSHWGWHSSFVSTMPLLVLSGAIAVTLFGTLWYRRGLNYRGLLATESIVAILFLFFYRQLRPQDWQRALRRADDLFFREGAVETASLFSPEYAVVLGPIYQFGVPFYIALAVFGWVGVVVVRRYEPGWLLLGTYSGFLLVLAGIQVRFAGQLAIPFSILGGLGVVYFVSMIDLARRPILFGDSPSPTASDRGDTITSFSVPDRNKTVSVMGIGLLIFGVSLIMVPGFAGQLSYSSSQASALEAIDDHATTFDREYPANYVLSEWDENRMYNHFVNGESRSYGYARGTYRDFISGSNPDGRYDQFDDRVGYVVITAVDEDAPRESVQHQLLANLGAGGDEQEPLSQYQLLTVDSDRSVAAFAVVPGATIVGSAQPGETLNVSTMVSADGTSFGYNRTVAVGGEGRFAVTVPYAGAYRVGSERITVSETDVVEGSQIDSGDTG